MEIRDVWVLRGPNIWASFPCLQAEVDLADLKDRSSEQIPGFNSRLKSWLPSLIEHRCSVGERGGFFQRLDRGTYMAHILEHVTLELQNLAGSDVGFGRARETDVDGVYRVAIEFEEEDLALAALDLGRRVVLAAVHDHPLDVPAELQKLRALGDDVRLGPSTGAIVAAAKARGIPTMRLNRESMVQLGQAAKAHRICTAETDQTRAIAEQIAQDKQLTRTLLHAVGVPVPIGRPVKDADDAWAAAEELGPPVVVKPQYGNHGRGVATDLQSKDQVLAAYQAAREESSYIMVESFLPGDDHRLLVIGGKLVAAALREPAQVIGDGRSTIRQLVDEVNKDPRRGEGHATVLTKIKLDTIGLQVLAEQGCTPDSVPAAGQKVLIRRNGNLSTGGTATDVTDQVHPEVAARAVEAACVVGLDIAGVDVVCTDISRPLEEQRGGIVEVNAGPGLRMHLQPSAGKPRPVGEAVVDSLFPTGETGRIPIVAVTGVNGKTTTCRLIAHVLARHGWNVALACTDGLYVRGRRINTHDCSGPRSARAALMNPMVEAAVFETARGGILREGLGYDSADVGVVTNIGSGDHLGYRGVSTLEELARVKSTVISAVRGGGAVVLNAADPIVAGMAKETTERIIYFSRDHSLELIQTHRASGGSAVLAREGMLVFAEGDRETTLLRLSDVPLTHGGAIPFEIDNAAAAAAALWGLGLPLDEIRAGLQSFAADARDLPGRFNVFAFGDATVVVDYGHNVSAMRAVAEAMEHLEHSRRSVVYSGFERRNEDLVEVGRVLGESFDRVVLFSDHGYAGRRDGELNSLLREGLAKGGRVAEIHEAANERAAVEEALRSLQPRELLVLGTGEIEATLNFVARCAADSTYVSQRQEVTAS
jgi:cyanophycin synthetase